MHCSLIVRPVLSLSLSLGDSVGEVMSDIGRTKTSHCDISTKFPYGSRLLCGPRTSTKFELSAGNTPWLLGSRPQVCVDLAAVSACSRWPKNGCLFADREIQLATPLQHIVIQADRPLVIKVLCSSTSSRKSREQLAALSMSSGRWRPLAGCCLVPHVCSTTQGN